MAPQGLSLEPPATAAGVHWPHTRLCDCVLYGIRLRKYFRLVCKCALYCFPQNIFECLYVSHPGVITANLAWFFLGFASKWLKRLMCAFARSWQNKSFLSQLKCYLWHSRSFQASLIFLCLDGFSLICVINEVLWPKQRSNSTHSYIQMQCTYMHSCI